MHKTFCNVVPFIIAFLATAPFQSAWAQNISEEFGHISTEEMNMKKCPIDTLAEAYVLFDKGKSVFEADNDGGFDIIFERQCRIKILNQNGYEFANINIDLYQERNIYETIKSIEAYTYNLNDGTIERTALDPNNIFEEKVSESYARKKFAMPKVKAGSVIEFRYTMVTPYVFHLPNWSFQWEIPVKYSEYRVGMIPFYDYSYILQGATKFDYFNSEEAKGATRNFAGIDYHEMIYTYGMRNLPAFRKEEFIASPSEYVVKIIFQLSTLIRPNGIKENYVSTWSLLQDEIIKSSTFGRFLRAANGPAKKAINDLNLKGLSETEKVKRIAEYIKTNFKWNEEISKATDKSIKRFIEEKSGSSVEINLFLVSMLNAAGFESYPVLLSTRAHGSIRYQYPFLNYFNNVIACLKINGKYILADGTDPISSFSNIPVYCINDKGLVIKKEEPVEWVNLSSDVISVTKEQFSLAIDEKAIRCKLKINATDYDSYEYYRNFINKTDAMENDFLKRGYTSVDSIVFVKSLSGADSINLNLNLSCNLENAGSLIYFSPFLNEPLAKNPLKIPERKYPVDFTYLKKREFNSVIPIPAGYTIQSVPAKIYYDNKDYYVFYEAVVADKLITVKAAYLFKKNIYQPNEYRSVKFFLQAIVDKFNEKIVLKKT
jgi:hypothetical protein